MPLKKYLDYDGLAYLLQRFPKTTVHCVFDDEFAGETATLTHGTTTYTKTVPATSPYELTFAVNELGTWTLQSSYLGTQYSDTVDITYLGQKGEIELTIVPDGSTAEPINSIPVWLKCANLNKSYTTLAEVLADTETYETLLADSNACQYMKRSTGWINAGLVPTMVSNTAPSGEAFGSAKYSNYDPYLVFNGIFGTDNDNERFLTKASPAYVGYYFPVAKICNRVKITQVYFSGEISQGVSAVTLYIEGSTDNSTYTTLLTKECSIEEVEQTLFLNFENSTAYNYYRVRSSGFNFANTYFSVRELQFYELADDSIVDDKDAMSLIGKYDYCSNALLSNATWAEAIASSDYWESVCNISVPKMVGDTAPSGQVLYTTQYNATYAAYKVFDKDLSTNWAAAASDSYGTMRVGYRFTEPQVIKVVSIDCSTIATPIRVVGFRIVAKNASETEWTTLLTVTDRNTNAKEYYYLNNTNAYTDYNIIIDSAPSSPIDNSRISELQFYGREKEVQYRATVPVMTSATTPSGVASDSGHYDYYDQYSGWHVFDGTTNRYLSPQNSVNQWISYTFPEAKTIKKMTIYTTPGADNESVPSVIKTQVKVNGDWIDLDTYNNSSTTLNATRYFENQYSSTDYRISFSGMVSNKSFVTIRDLQFYEEVPGDAIIHSAPNDTIYYVDGEDNQMPICTTNENGIGKCDLSGFQAGPVTLYSSVAKNPDDLTADYSKTIMFTKTQYGGTTEAYLMPDIIKTLYWWGYKSDIETSNTNNGWTSPSSSRTFMNPTYNTNDILDSTGSTTSWNFSGVGTINPVNPTKCYSIATGVSKQSTSQYGYFSVYSSKALSSQNQYDHIDITSTSLTKYSIDCSIANCYITVFASNGSHNLYALWYE